MLHEMPIRVISVKGKELNCELLCHCLCTSEFLN